jgi:hypothetical protein
MWHRVLWYKFNDVSEERIVSFFSVKSKPSNLLLALLDHFIVCSEDGNSTSLRNVCQLLLHYTASQSKV